MKADLALFLAFPATILAVEVVLRLRFREILGAWLAGMQSASKLFADKSLSDDEKQEQMASAAAKTLIGTFKIFAIIVLALAMFIGAYGAGISLTRLDTSLPETLTRVDVQLASVVFALIWLWVRSRVFG